MDRKIRLTTLEVWLFALVFGVIMWSIHGPGGVLIGTALVPAAVYLGIKYSSFLSPPGWQASKPTLVYLKRWLQYPALILFGIWLNLLLLHLPNNPAAAIARSMILGLTVIGGLLWAVLVTDPHLRIRKESARQSRARPRRP